MYKRREQARRALSAGRGVARSGGVAPVSATAAELGEQPVSLNFVDTEVEAVVRALSRATGRQFLVDPRVKGKLTLVSEGQVPARTAYRMLTSALRMQGFSVVDVDGVSQVVPEADAKLLGGPVYGADRPAANGMVTRTFRLRYENAVNLIPVLRPIVAQNNPINAYPGNNTVVVTDYAENLDRVAGIIASIDIPSASDTDVVPIQNGIAVDIASTVSELLDSQGSGGAEQGQKTVVLADPRSNSIVIRSPSPERTQLARDLIGKLDSVQSNPGNLHVVYLRNAQATRLAQALRGLITGDSGTGKSYMAELMHEFAIAQGLLAPDAPFVSFNCAQYASNPELLAANLFGYVKGAFTGAQSDKAGAFEAANGGMPFLDEAHRLAAQGQAKRLT
ncbi:sigma 54-interacting transcriptional regulator, partial [Pseudomonas aeruginosa]|nr:sigma 54-interacting transcriptional regulator [Pseudomonas aeruginosa]